MKDFRLIWWLVQRMTFTGGMHAPRPISVTSLGASRLAPKLANRVFHFFHRNPGHTNGAFRAKKTEKTVTLKELILAGPEHPRPHHANTGLDQKSQGADLITYLERPVLKRWNLMGTPGPSRRILGRTENVKNFSSIGIDQLSVVSNFAWQLHPSLFGQHSLLRRDRQLLYIRPWSVGWTRSSDVTHCQALSQEYVGGSPEGQLWTDNERYTIKLATNIRRSSRIQEHRTGPFWWISISKLYIHLKILT